MNDLFKNTFRKNAELSFPKRVRLICFKEHQGILRCAHLDQEYVCEKINRITIGEKKTKKGFQTLGCSGTLRVLCKKYGVEKPRRRKNFKNSLLVW